MLDGTASNRSAERPRKPWRIRSQLIDSKDPTPQPPTPTTTPHAERLGPGGEDGGGCAIADAGSTPKSTVFNLFLAISVLFPAISSNRTLSLSTSKEAKLPLAL